MEKCVSLWLVAREAISQICRRAASDLPSITILPAAPPHLCPSHSSSVPAILVARHQLALTTADQLQHRCRYGLLFRPPSVVLCLPLPLCLLTCVVAIQHPALGDCSACSGRYTRYSHGRAAARVDLPNPPHVCAVLYRMTVTHSPHFSDIRAKGTQMRTGISLLCRFSLFRTKKCVAHSFSSMNTNSVSLSISSKYQTTLFSIYE